MFNPRAYVFKTWRDSHRLVIVQDSISTGNIVVLRDFVFETVPEGAMFDPMQGVGQADDLIQSIMDAAWKAGFRPRGFSDIENETKALRDHLGDMKTIAFHQLKIKRKD